MNTRTKNSWIHIFMIVIIALMPLRALTANADLSASAATTSIHQAESHDAEHQDCNMDSVCFTDCQAGTTHCSSTSVVPPSYEQGALPPASYLPPVANAEHVQSITDRNLFRPPRNIA